MSCASNRFDYCNIHTTNRIRTVKCACMHSCIPHILSMISLSYIHTQFLPLIYSIGSSFPCQAESLQICKPICHIFQRTAGIIISKVSKRLPLIYFVLKASRISVDCRYSTQNQPSFYSLAPVSSQFRLYPFLKAFFSPHSICTFGLKPIHTNTHVRISAQPPASSKTFFPIVLFCLLSPNHGNKYHHSSILCSFSCLSSCDRFRCIKQLVAVVWKIRSRRGNEARKELLFSLR